MIRNDRGGHCRWEGWMRICEEEGLVRSMSKKGCDPDNAACEGFFAESCYPEKWSRSKADDLIGEIDACVEWHNERRIKSSLGYMSPMEYRKSLGYEP